MPQQLLIQTSGQDGHSLEINGRRVADNHEQIVAILRSRLGQNHADFLARPAWDAAGTLSWTTHLAGTAQRASALSDEDRQKLEKTAARLVSDIRGLAAQMQAESPATQLVGQMLERAAQVPPGNWLYSVGGKAVTAMWAHSGSAVATGAPVAAAAAAGGSALVSSAVPAAPPSASGLPATAAAAAPGGPDVIDVESRNVSGTAAVAAAAAGGGNKRPWLRWLLWLLLILLLLALLFFGLKRCTGGPDGGSVLSGALGDVEKQNKELEDEIARRKSQQSQFQCVPEPPKPPEPPASQPEPPASVPEPPASKPEPPASKPQPPASKPQPPASKPQPPASKPEPPASKPPPPPPPAPVAKCKPHQPGDEPEVVMIVDASGSMNEKFGGGGSRLEAAKRAADAMIRSLPQDVDVGLVDFGACGQVRRDKFYSAGERGALIGEINGLSPKNGTPLADAIRRAGTIASSSADSVMVIVSDGDDSCGGDPCAAARAAKAAKPGLIINVIDLSESAKDRQVLQCIASAGGGRVLSPGDPLDLARKMKEAVAPANCK